jgi:hypothetical protein
MIMLKISRSDEWARMLRMGFGDALDFGISLDELEYRVLRLAHFAQSLPRYRHHGALKIDLLAREAFVASRALGLCIRAYLRCGGGWPTIRVRRLPRANCSAMSGTWPSGPRPTAWRFTSVGFVPSCGFPGSTDWSKPHPTAHSGWLRCIVR